MASLFWASYFSYFFRPFFLLSKSKEYMKAKEGQKGAAETQEEGARFRLCVLDLRRMNGLFLFLFFSSFEARL